jgi:Fibronectin type III domain
VTTVEPGSFANGVGLRVAIGGSSYDWLGGGAGGVAYVNTYTNSIVNTVYVFPAQLSNGTAKYVGEASSHEAGHAYGLNHQSQYDANGTLLADYYAGANGRAPIMGNSYGATRGLWWYGTTSSSTTYQDDLSVISRSTNTFGYRPDDVGNTAASASALTQNDTQVSAAGVITQTTDVDVFSFASEPGTITLSVNVAANNNLDSILELQTATGVVLATAAPTTSFGASLSYNVTAAGSYRLAVKSQGSYGDVGQYTVRGTIVPNNTAVAAPTNLIATKGVGSVGLSWIDNAGNETGYTVQRSTDGGGTFADIASLGVDANAYSDVNVTAGSAYVYRVQAVSGTFTSNFSNTANVTFAPATPSNLAASATSTSAISLSWGDVAGETGYKILRSTDNTSFTQIATTAANATSYSNTGLTSATTYYYMVVANNAGGDSTASNTASATTLTTITTPTSPTNLTVTSSTATSVSLQWTDRATNESGYYVERRVNNRGSYSRIATLGANVTTFTDASVSPNTTYTYRVRAYNSAGTSSASNTVSIRTPAASATSSTTNGEVVVNGNSNANSQAAAETTPLDRQGKSCADNAMETVYRMIGERDDYLESILGSSLKTTTLSMKSRQV